MPTRPSFTALLGTVALTLCVFAPGAEAHVYHPELGHQTSPPITLSTEAGAETPNVAIDANGTGWFSWTVDLTPVHKVVLCEVPKGGSACTYTHEFPAPVGNNSMGDSKVIVESPTKIDVLYHSVFYTYLTTTTNATSATPTWNAPIAVGSADPSHAIAGPGPFLLEIPNTSSNTGALLQTVDRTGGNPSGAALGAQVTQGYYEGGVALPDATHPIFAFTDLDDTYFTQYVGGSGAQTSVDYNDTSKWGPLQKIPGEFDPRLVGGQSGTYLLTGSGSADVTQYEVRQYNAATKAFGNPTTISETGEQAFRGTITEDTSGGLEATWIDNNTTLDPNDNGSGPIRTSYSPNGANWTERRTVQDSTDSGATNLQIGAGPDGSGFVTYDRYGNGLIQAAVIPAAGSPGADPPPATGGGTGGSGGGTPAGSGPPQVPVTNCPTYQQNVSTVVIARAQGGCFTSAGAGKWTTTSDVRLNGIDFIHGGSTLSIDTVKHTVDVTGGTQVAGGIQLHSGALHLDVSNPTTPIAIPGTSGGQLLGFNVSGSATLTFPSVGTADAHLNVELPFPFDGVTGATDAITSMANGLEANGLTIGPVDANVGIMSVKNLVISYTGGTSTFEGHADFYLPPQDQKPLHVDIGFVNGNFDHASLTDYTGPPLPIVLYPPGIFLDSVGFETSVSNGFRLAGSVGIGAGPNIPAIPLLGIPRGPALSLDGNLVFAIPKGANYATLSASGTLRLIGESLGGGSLTFDTRGILTASAYVDLKYLDGAVGLKGTIGAIVDVTQPAFQAEGDATVCIPGDCHDILGVAHFEAGASVLLSTKGFGACAKVLGDSFGVIEVYGETPEKELSDCSGSGYDEIKIGDSAFASKVTASASRFAVPQSFTIPKGTKQFDLKVIGSSGIPAVTLTGPGGRVVQTLPGHPEAMNHDDQGGIVIPAPGDAHQAPYATVLVGHNPAPGTWTLAPQEGSAPIADVKIQHTLPDVAVTATVKHSKGRAFTLGYKTPGLEGRTVQFAEQTKGVLHPIGSTKKAFGTIRFQASDGPAGKRDIVATVINQDIPTKQLTAAHFTAPAPVKPAKASVRITRSKGGAKVSWSKSAGAAQYRVQLNLSDGRKLQLSFPSTQRSVVIPAVATTVSATVTVTGVSQRGAIGTPGKTTLKAAKAKKTTPAKKKTAKKK